jgi:putative DNA methylase
MTPTIFGFETFADLFTRRQLVAITTYSDLVLEARSKALDDARAAGMDFDQTPLADGGTGAKAYADGVAVYLSFAWTSLQTWETRFAVGNQSPNAPDSCLGDKRYR